MVWRVRMTFLALVFTWLIVPTCHCDEPPRQVAVSSQSLERFKVATDGGPLLLPVDIQGKRYFFALDTGASRSFYDTSLRFTLGAPSRTLVKVVTASNNVELQEFRSPPAKLGRLDLPANMPICCLDMEGLRKIWGEEVYGILGMDVLKNYIVRINFDRGEVTFLRSVDPDPGKRVPIFFRKNCPHVVLEIPGLAKKELFLLDTGWGTFNGTFHSAVFATLAKERRLSLNNPLEVRTPSGISTQRSGCVEAISLGGYDHKKLRFCEAGLNTLGRGYLSRYVVTFDFPNSVIYLKKGQNFDRSDVVGQTGMSILRRKGVTWVMSVDDSSPAALAGIRPQDVLLEINGMKTSDISLSALGNLFAENGAEYRILIRRQERNIEIKMTVPHEDK